MRKSSFHLYIPRAKRTCDHLFHTKVYIRKINTHSLQNRMNHKSDTMNVESVIDRRQKGLENFILLLLGVVDRRISLLHLEKEVFFLWNFHPKIKEYLNFIKHYRGPFSREIQEAIQDPLYLEDHWVYTPPRGRDKLSGGYVELSDTGREEYDRLIKEIGKQEDILHLLAGMKMVRTLYDRLTMEELLLLVYDTYPEYSEKSNVYREIKRKGKLLAERLKKKGVIDEERFDSLMRVTAVMGSLLLL